MQRSNNNNEKKCEKIPPTCCGEQPQRPAMPPANARSRPIHNFPPQHQNPRFSLTPQTMNLNLNVGDQAVCKDYREKPQPQPLPQQQSFEPPPLVDVKPYNERYHSQQSLGNASDLQLMDRNTSYHSSQTIPNTSYASIKTENNVQQLTPPTPLTPPRSAGSNICQQQWNFDQNDQQQKQQPPSCYSSGSHISAVHCSSKSIQRLTSTIKLSPANSPCTSPTYSTHAVRSPSQDSCIPISNCPSVTGEMPTSYFEQQLQKYTKNTDVCTDGATKINYGTLNNIFLQRLHDIDKNAWGDRDLKLITFQEWVDMLLKINDSFITNMEELEREVSKRLELVQQRVNTQLIKCRRDIDALIKIIQNLYCNKILDLNGVTFETINTEDVLPRNEILNMEGSNMLQYNNDSEIMQRNKLLANIKALALEVADKHDEVRDLKRQIICLEEDIQKAQQKIQLKDDVIKELRSDLKCANSKLSASHHQLVQEANLAMPPINFENQTDRTANTQVTDLHTLAFQDENGSQFDSLSHNEQEEQQKIKVLEEELNEFFEISREWNKQKIESQRKRLMDIFQTVEGEKAKAYRKLDYMRRQLIDLECTNVEGINNDCDSGFHSKSENDQDAKILDAVRKRLRKLNETNMELKKKMQKLEMDNSELATNLQTEKCFSQRNSETLKQVADLLSSMNAEQFSYTDIYNKTSIEQNPFCEAILGMKKAFQEREDQLLHLVGIRNKQISELMNNEKNYIEERAAHLNESLKCQIDHLRRTLCERDQRIMQLTSMLKSFSQVQSNEPHQAALEFVNSRNNFAADQQRKIDALNQKLEKSMQEQRFLHKEARRLNEDLNEAKKKNGDLISQVSRLGDLLKSQETHRMELAAKYEDLEHNYEDQAKKLRTANNQLCMLNERFHVMERRQTDHNMENTILREEVLSLKEKHACAMGNQKSLQDQLLKTEKELYTAHNVIKEQQAIMQRNECNHKEMMQHLNADNCDLKRKLNQLIEDYKRLQEEHDKQKEINNHQCKLLESYCKWKEQQLKAETKTRDGFKQLEDLIRNLLEEKQTYLDHYWDLQKDYTLLQNELDRLKMCSFSLSNYSALRNSSEKSIAERLEIVRRTTRRVSDQSSSFKEDEREAVLQAGASTPVLPSEEPL